MPMGHRGRGGTLPNRGTIINNHVTASVLGGQVYGKLFIPTTAVPGTALGLFVYIPSSGGQSDQFSSTTFGQYCTASPASIPFYVYAPQFPGGSQVQSPVKNTWAAIVEGMKQIRALGYNFNPNKIVLGGYSAGASLGAKYIYSFPGMFAGWAPDDMNINWSNMVGHPTLNDEYASATVMDPATITNDTQCFNEFATRLKASKCKMLLDFGDITLDSGNYMTAMGTALTALGATVVTTHTHTTVLTSDSYVQSIHDGKDHNAMEGDAWNSTNRATTIAWINARVRT
jgi:pimeloyl-ACP methyl ester carboxylesterase